jgi:FkbM family methyltransferase
MTHTVGFEAGGKQLTLAFASEHDHIARAIAHSGTFYEAELLADLRSRLFFPVCAVDVGAHVGNHTLYLAHVLGLRTISFEPNPQNFALLATNVHANGLDDICTLHNLAVGAAPGRVRTLDAGDDNTGMATVEADPAGSVAMARLDDTVLAAPRLDVIKIDVEGWELEVLRGADAVLRERRPLLYIEILAPRFGTIETHLRERGYQCWKRFNHTPTFLFLPRERLAGG